MSSILSPIYSVYNQPLVTSQEKFCRGIQGCVFESRAVWWLPVAVTVHNLEEAIWMPRFWAAHSWHVISTVEFRVGAVMVAALAFAITYAAERCPQSILATRLLVIFCVVMFLNAFWHIGATAYLHAYAPGVVTAVLIVLPVTGYLLFHLLPGVRSFRRQFAFLCRED